MQKALNSIFGTTSKMKKKIYLCVYPSSKYVQTIQKEKREISKKGRLALSLIKLETMAQSSVERLCNLKTGLVPGRGGPHL